MTASEDLTIDGQVEGSIELIDHVLTIGARATVNAQIVAKTVTIRGSVTGNVAAREKVEVRSTGSLDGDVVAPRIVLVEGAQVRGRMETGSLNGTAGTAPETQTGRRIVSSPTRVTGGTHPARVV